MRTAFIYGLRCPLTGLIRYIGKAENPKKRLAVHLASKAQCHRTNWIRHLTRHGLKPTLEVIAEVSASTWQFWERSYIHLYRSLGLDLVNSTAGGDGTFNPTPETIAKQRAAKLGKRVSSQTCERMSRARLNRKTSLNISGFTGIGWCKRDAKWRAKLTFTGKLIQLGRFSKIEDAVFVRALAVDKYYGNCKRN